MRALILRLDMQGQPVSWLSWQGCVILYARGQVAWTAGQHEFEFHGGVNRLTGRRSSMRINSIVATHGAARRRASFNEVPPLSNRELFLRDGNLCMYCGTSLPGRHLTRDHVIPISRGGQSCWSNIVTACRECNTRKGARTPDEAHMPLLAVPYVPNRAEYLVLSNRRILADQMDFLRARFRQDSPLRMPAADAAGIH